MTDKQPTAYEVPFVELLESVPNNSRLWVDFPEGMGSRHFPVGHYCHKAAAELRRLHEVNAELVEELKNIANANPSKWDAEVRDQFQQWAQNRARAAIAKATGEQQ
jgi:hypothetical protein